MSEDVICISSSDDEDNIPKKSNKNFNKEKKSVHDSNQSKRRLSSNSSANDSNSKRHKYQEKEMVSSNTSNHGNNSPTVISNTRKFASIDQWKKERETKGSINPPPECGTSKYFDKIEKKFISEAEIEDTVKSRFSVPPDKSEKSSSIRKVVKPQLVVKEKVPIPDPSDNVFEQFLQVCKKRKNDDATIAILNSLKRCYDKLEPIEKKNDEFRLFLNASIQKITNGHNEFYSIIKGVKEEIKKHIKNKTNKEENNTDEAEEIEVSEEVWEKIRDLQNVIKTCRERIYKLETQEVDFEEEEDSSYLKKDRYERKIVQLCAELTKLVKDNKLKRQIFKRQLKRKDITAEMTGIISVDEAIISFVNSGIKKVNRLKHVENFSAIPDYLAMPDYPDILQCISKCNNEEGLNLNKKKMEKLAESAFKAIGRYLKKQRIKESEECLSSFAELDSEGDPAVKNPELREKLRKNKTEGDKKLEEIFKKYAEKQDGLSVEDWEKEQAQTSSSDTSEDESNNTFRSENKKHQKRPRDTSDEDEENKDSKSKEIKKTKDKNNKKYDIKEDSATQIKNIINESTSSKELVIDERGNSDKEDKEVKLNSNKDESAAKENETAKICINQKDSVDTESNETSNPNTNLTNDESAVFTILSEISGLANDTKPNNDVLPNIVPTDDDEIQILSDGEDKNPKDKQIVFTNEITNETDDCILDVNAMEVDKDPLSIDTSKVNDEITNLTPMPKDDSTAEDICDDDKLESDTEIRSSKCDENNQIICVPKGNESKNSNTCNFSETNNKTRTVIGEVSKKDVTSKIESIQTIPEIDKSTVSHDISTTNKEILIINEVNKEISITNEVNKEIPEHCTYPHNSSETNNKTRTVIGEVSKKDVTSKIDSTQTIPEIDKSAVSHDISTANKEILIIDEVNKETLITNEVNKKIPEHCSKLMPIEVEEVFEEIEEIELFDVSKESNKESKSKEVEVPLKEIVCSADKDKSEPRKSSLSFLKVRSFAKPPDSWKESLSPEKTKHNLKVPIQQVLQDLSKPECVDLTNEKESRTSSSKTRFINPLAINKRRIPIKNVVLLKKLSNNQNVSQSADSVKKDTNETSKNIQYQIPLYKKSDTVSTNNSQVNTNQVPTNNNQRTQVVARSVLKKPFVLVLPYNKEKS